MTIEEEQFAKIVQYWFRIKNGHGDGKTFVKGVKPDRSLSDIGKNDFGLESFVTTRIRQNEYNRLYGCQARQGSICPTCRLPIPNLTAAA